MYLAVFLAGLAAGLAALLATAPGRKSKKSQKLLAHSGKQLVEEQVKADQRRDRAEDAETLRRKIMTGTLCLLIALTVGMAYSATTRAAETLPTQTVAATPQAGPSIPGDYETLKRYYLAAWDLSERYRSLYQQAEESSRDLRESNARLLQIIEEQREEIRALQDRGPSFGLTGGATWLPASGPGLFLGGCIMW